MDRHCFSILSYSCACEWKCQQNIIVHYCTWLCCSKCSALESKMFLKPLYPKLGLIRIFLPMYLTVSVACDPQLLLVEVELALSKIQQIPKQTCNNSY